MKIHQERENILISEKFIQANIYLSSENKKIFRNLRRNNKKETSFIQF